LRIARFGHGRAVPGAFFDDAMPALAQRHGGLAGRPVPAFSRPFRPGRRIPACVRAIYGRMPQYAAPGGRTCRPRRATARPSRAGRAARSFPRRGVAGRPGAEPRTPGSGYRTAQPGRRARTGRRGRQRRRRGAGRRAGGRRQDAGPHPHAAKSAAGWTVARSAPARALFGRSGHGGRIVQRGGAICACPKLPGPAPGPDLHRAQDRARQEQAAAEGRREAGLRILHDSMRSHK